MTRRILCYYNHRSKRPTEVYRIEIPQFCLFPQIASPHRLFYAGGRWRRQCRGRHIVAFPRRALRRRFFGNLDASRQRNAARDERAYLLIFNVPFFLFGLKRLGASFIVHSLFAVGVYALFSYLFQSVFEIDFSAGSPVAGADILLCALFGGVISGIGSGITIRFGGAIDGVEVLAVVFAKRIGITVGSFVMSYNVVLYVVAGIVTKDWIAPLYSIIAYTAGLKAVDFVIDGFDKAKSAFIITDRHNEVAEMLSKEFGRGVTSIDAEGYYSRTPKTVLYRVVNRFEVGKLKSVVTEIDPNAFLVINDVTDSLGSSLRYESRIRRKINKVIAEKEAEKSLRDSAGGPSDIDSTSNQTADFAPSRDSLPAADTHPDATSPHDSDSENGENR